MSNEKTMKGLAEAFAGESQANRKYAIFAAQAEKEGYKQAAKLFRAASEAETIHAADHLRNMGYIKSTKENLLAAIEGETHEFESMYPEFIAWAKEENQGSALRGFELAAAAEAVHAGLYKKALASLEDEKLVDIYMCKVCGNLVEGDLPDECAICKARSMAFKKID